MRSDRYPAYYRVGSFDECDIYWHPQWGYYIEGDQCLVGIDDVSQVDWFDQAGDLDKITSDLRDSNGKLAEAMAGDRCLGREDIRGHILDAIEDGAFAVECEGEKRATLRNGAFRI